MPSSVLYLSPSCARICRTWRTPSIGKIRANWALHERIAAIGPNAMARAVYIGTLGPLHATSSRFDDERAAADYRAQRYRIHADLVDAIAAGDEAAVRVVVDRHNTTV